MTKKVRGNQLAPISKDSMKPLGVISKGSIKAFDSSKPVKVLQS
jgi:hypothetical protein